MLLPASHSCSNWMNMRQCEVLVRNYLLLCFYYVCESKFETKHKRTLSHPDRGEAQEQNTDDLKCTENVNVIGSFEENLFLRGA